MIEEIEDLWTLAEECRELARVRAARGTIDDAALAGQFDRIADKLDDIAKRLAAGDQSI